MNFKISLSARELIFTMVSRVLRQYFKLYIILYENFVYAVSYAFHYAAVYVSMKMDFEIIQVCSDLYQFFAGFSFESTLSIASCNTRCSTFHLEINISFAPAFLSIVNIDVISHKFLTYVCIESTKILFKIYNQEWQNTTTKSINRTNHSPFLHKIRYRRDHNTVRFPKGGRF